LGSFKEVLLKQFAHFAQLVHSLDILGVHLAPCVRLDYFQRLLVQARAHSVLLDTFPIFPQLLSVILANLALSQTVLEKQCVQVAQITRSQVLLQPLAVLV
jgi:hypothetical protein